MRGVFSVLCSGFFIFSILVSSRICRASIQVFELTESEAIAKAKQSSESLKSADSDWQASQEQAEASYSLLLPKLSFDASYRYVTQVPSIQLPLPNAPPIPISAHSNYSIGPTLSYTLWDSGFAKNRYYSHQKMAESRKEEQKNLSTQVVGSVKLAYTRVQLGVEQLKMVKDSLNQADAQNKYIEDRFEAGTADRLDLLTSQREVLNYQLQLKQQQADLASALKDLLALLSETGVRDFSRPAPYGYSPATVWLKLDSLEESLQTQTQGEPEVLEGESPQIKSQALLTESLEYGAKSQSASSYPQLQISARTSLDYPNGPIIENINQNTLSASLSFPLFEFNRNGHEVAEKEKEADAARHRKNQLQLDLSRDFWKAKEQLRSLREQQKDSEESVRQSELLAKLNYDSYRNGRITLVDVQAANVRALQAKVDLARIRAQILNQVTQLKVISGKDD